MNSNTPQGTPIAIRIAGTRIRKVGFVPIYNGGKFTEESNAQMDSPTAIQEDPVFVIRHTQEHLIYMLKDCKVISSDANTPGILCIALTIGNNVRLSNGVSPYTVLMELYDKFKENYMEHLPNGTDKFLGKNINNEDFEEIYYKYAKAVEQTQRRICFTDPNKYGKVGILRIPKYKLEDFFLDTQYPEFVNFKEIQVGSDCESSPELKNFKMREALTVISPVIPGAGGIVTETPAGPGGESTEVVTVPGSSESSKSELAGQQDVGDVPEINKGGEVPEVEVLPDSQDRQTKEFGSKKDETEPFKRETREIKPGDVRRAGKITPTQGGQTTKQVKDSPEPTKPEEPDDRKKRLIIYLQYGLTALLIFALTLIGIIKFCGGHSSENQQIAAAPETPQPSVGENIGENGGGEEEEENTQKENSTTEEVTDEHGQLAAAQNQEDFGTSGDYTAAQIVSNANSLKNSGNNGSGGSQKGEEAKKDQSQNNAAGGSKKDEQKNKNEEKEQLVSDSNESSKTTQTKAIIKQLNEHSSEYKTPYTRKYFKKAEQKAIDYALDNQKDINKNNITFTDLNSIMLYYKKNKKAK